ncbi:MAG TPA: hypothetical protein VK126_04325, partial [Nitrososphaerales archaeon]|nr:hypothetical protein [Nitrososphaerales archaeon]
MDVSLLTGLLQVVSTTNSTSTTTALAEAKPLWLTAAEVVALIVGVAVVGTFLARFVRTIALRAGASKAVANSIRSWMGVLM